MNKGFLRVIGIAMSAAIFFVSEMPDGVAGDRSNYERSIASLSHVEVMASISTPYEAMRYLLSYLRYVSDSDAYDERDYVASFRIVHERRCDDCDGGAIAAAALLSDDGYPPLLLCMYNDDHTMAHMGGHTVFIYHDGKRWGTLGIKEYDCMMPFYESVEGIVERYGFSKYNIKKIDELCDDWIDNDVNMSDMIYDPVTAVSIKKEGQKID